MRLLALMDNLPSTNLALKAEHGLSIYVQYKDTEFIFDCGQSASTWINARKLGIDLNKSEFIVLSHGHYDHVLGLLDYPKGNNELDIYVGSGFFDPKYKKEGAALTYLGGGYPREKMIEDGYKVHELSTSFTIRPGIHLVTEFSDEHSELNNPAFVVERQGNISTDDFRDEVAVVLEVEHGLAMLVGCSHPKIERMVSIVQKQFDKPVVALFGGTHLVDRSSEELDKSLEWFEQSEIKTLGLSHCTGNEGIARLKTLSDLTVNPLTVGTLFYLKEDLV